MRREHLGQERWDQSMEQPVSVSEPIPVDEQVRQWALHVISLLLGLQALGMSAYIIQTFLAVQWQVELPRGQLSAAAMDVIVFGFLLLPLALLGAWTAIGFQLKQRRAWQQAMVMQGTLLAICLITYVSGRRMGWLYLLMLSCIIIVLYLNTNEMRFTFYVKRR